jgi:hypothetical protein
MAADDFGPRVRAFFDGIKAVFNSGVVWTFPGEVTELDTTTGVLEDVHAITAPAQVVGTGSAAMAAPAGARVRWLTPAVVNSRRLAGSTFLVPLMASSYEPNGSLLGTSITTINTAATAYLDTGVFESCQPVVWSRTHGILADATAFVVPDKVAVLRSRRD